MFNTLLHQKLLQKTNTIPELKNSANRCIQTISSLLWILKDALHRFRYRIQEILSNKFYKYRSGIYSKWLTMKWTTLRRNAKIFSLPFPSPDFISIVSSNETLKKKLLVRHKIHQTKNHISSIWLDFGENQ